MNTRVHIILGGVISLLVMLATACGSTPGPTEAAQPGVEATAPLGAAEPTESPEPAQPDRGGTVIWGTATEPDTMDHQCTFSSIADVQHRTIFDALVFWAPDGEFYPYLAESWETNDDASSYTFHLREDVVFHDGTPFNAEAVRFNLDRLTTVECAQGQVALGRLGGTYVSTDVVDEFTVRINFSAPNPTFLIAADGLYYHSPAAVEEFGDDLGRNPVGTGAFTFEEWVDQDHLTVVRNPDYNWPPTFAQHDGPAYLESITWRFIPEAATRLAALELGEVNLVNRFDFAEYDTLVTNDDLVWVSNPMPGLPTGWMINAILAPTDDINVRRAICHGIDRQTALQTLFGDFNTVAYGPLSSGTFGYWEGVEGYCDYDPDQALSMLEGAGWTDSDGDGMLDKDGETLTLSLMDLTDNPERSAAWEFFQAQLRDLGIELDVQFAEAGVVVEECHGARQNICGLRWRMADPIEMRAVFAGANIGSGFNWTHYQDERIDELLEAGASEADPDARVAIYRELQERIMDAAIFVPIWESPMIHGAEPSLQDWYVMPNPEYIWLYDAYIEQ